MCSVELFDEIDADGAVVRSAFSLNAYDQLPEGHQWVEHTVPLDKIKAMKKAQIEAWRDAACVVPVSVAISGTAHTWDADPHSQTLISTTVSLVSMGVMAMPDYWRSAQNESVLVYLDDLQAIAGAIAGQTRFAYGKSWALKALVDAATDAAGVEAVGW